MTHALPLAFILATCIQADVYSLGATAVYLWEGESALTLALAIFKLTDKVYRPLLPLLCKEKRFKKPKAQYV